MKEIRDNTPGIMPFEVLCVIGTNSLVPGFAPGDYFYHTRLVAFCLNNPAPDENDE